MLFTSVPQPSAYLSFRTHHIVINLHSSPKPCLSFYCVINVLSLLYHQYPDTLLLWLRSLKKQKTKALRWHIFPSGYYPFPLPYLSRVACIIPCVPFLSYPSPWNPFNGVPSSPSDPKGSCEDGHSLPSSPSHCIHCPVSIAHLT